jgi:hypothetical protein
MDLLHGGGSFVNSAARCGRGGNNKRGGGNSRGHDNGRGNGGRPPQHNDSTGDRPTCQLWQGGPHGSTPLQTLRRLLHWAAGE